MLRECRFFLSFFGGLCEEGVFWLVSVCGDLE